MKKIFRNIILLSVAGMIMNSCSLDEYNPSAGDATVTSYNAWNGLLYNCYSALNDQIYTASDWLYVSEGGTDLWNIKSNGTGYKQLLAYEDATSSYNSFQKLWKQCYSMISNCNTVINEAANLTDASDTAVKVKEMVAEAKTLRALYYSILVEQFGPVTLNTESSSSITGHIDLYPKRSSEKAIYDLIIKDLTEAVVDLPVKPVDDNVARFSKKSAIGLLARVYAQRAGLKKYGDSQEYWRLAAKTAEDFISNASMYDAKLYTDIADMWADANNRTNAEALMVAAGADAGNANWQYMSKNNKLSAYTAGGSYSDFFNKNHNPGDKGYFYGRLNSQNWSPTKYLMYCFNPEWDRRWEYTWQYAWGEWTMVQCGWIPYKAGQMVLTRKTCLKYGIDSTYAATVYDPATGKEIANPDSRSVRTIYPYADCDGIATDNGAGNQFPAKIWPKGETAGNVKDLLTVAPSSDMCGQKGYTETTKAYAVPYPVTSDDNRINTVFVHEKPADASKYPFAVVYLADLYDSNGLPYGGIEQGSEAGNPPAIGNGKTSSSACPGLIKFNWSFNGCFYSGNLQIKTGNMFIMRMAEVYLLAAEAEQQLGNGAKAAEYLNVLRQRAARPGVAASVWKLTNATEDDIFDEYAREMCGEFNRWALLKRHNAFESRLAKYNKRAAASFKPYHYNRPIAYDFLSTILNKEEYGDNGYGSTAKSGLDGIE